MGFNLFPRLQTQAPLHSSKHGFSEPLHTMHVMKASTKRELGFGWLGISIALGGVASAQFVCMLLEVYDPVRDDHMAPEFLPFARAWLVFLIIAYWTSAFFAYRYVRRNNVA